MKIERFCYNAKVVIYTLKVSCINYEPHNQFKIQNYLVEPGLNRLIRENDTITLETKVMAALLLLVKHRQQLVTRQQMREALWPNTVVSDHAINRIISHLRKAFVDDQLPYRVITTIPKKGYQLIADVVPVIKDSKTATSSKVEIKRRRSPWQIPVIFTSLFVLVFTILGFNHQSGLKAFIPKKAVTKFSSLTGFEHRPAYNFNNQLLAYIHHNRNSKVNRLMLRGITSTQPREIISTHESIDSFAWSPKENELILALRGDKGCRLEMIQFDIDETIKRHSFLDCRNKTIYHIAWSNFDNNLYLIGLNGQISDLYQLQMSKPNSLLQKVAQGAGAYFVSVSSDGNQLVLLRHQQFERSQVFLFDIATSSEHLFYQSPYFLQSISWARQDKALFYSELTKFKLHGLNGEVQTLPFSSEHRIIDTYFVAGQEKFLYSSSKYEARLHQINKKNDLWSEAKLLPWGAAAKEVIPTYSNDGKQLAFISNRNGDNQIWIKDDKDKLRVLDTQELDLSQTLLRWSPDDRYLMYHGDRSLYRFDLLENNNQRISPKHMYADVVNWSYQNNDKVYLRNNDDGEMDIWQLEIASQKLTRITQDGGFSANASRDGQFLYYIKQQYPGLWRHNLISGESKLILDDFHYGNWRSWQLMDKGLYYSRTPDGQRGVYYYDFYTKQHQTIWKVPAGYDAGFHVHPNEKIITLDIGRLGESDIMMVEG